MKKFLLILIAALLMVAFTPVPAEGSQLKPVTFYNDTGYTLKFAIYNIDGPDPQMVMKGETKPMASVGFELPVGLYAIAIVAFDSEGKARGFLVNRFKVPVNSDEVDIRIGDPEHKAVPADKI